MYVTEKKLKSTLILCKNRKLGVGLKDDEKVKELLETDDFEEIAKYQASDYVYNLFGELVLLMCSRILTKPNFSGYTEVYKDEMISDAVSKVFLYYHNFDFRKKSEKTGKQTSAFSYVSQIIHHAFIYIINKMNSENTKKYDYIDKVRNNWFLEHKETEDFRDIYIEEIEKQGYLKEKFLDLEKSRKYNFRLFYSTKTTKNRVLFKKFLKFLENYKEYDINIEHIF